ncbi:MAG: cation diffusion facilitator family transporter [Eubacteriales bacterium]|nr:cation diffusion facilitator family transporter [Eubacteriales bacterium]
MTRKKIEQLISKNGWDNIKAREELGITSGIVGIVCNMILCAFKFFVGSVTNSVSITADAVNNLSDAGSNIVTIAGSKLSAKPVDKEHPFGHGRIEYISALIVSFFIFLMGFELGKSSVEKIIHPEAVEFGIWNLIILIAAIGVKLWMAYFNNNLYKATGNINMKAVKQDSLNDCLATGATIVALVISSFTKFNRADGIIGLVVAILILLAGIDIIKDIIGPLLGQAPSEELVNNIESIMLSDEHIVGVHDLIVHDYGPGRIIASAHAEVPADSDIVIIHDIIDNIEKEISERLKIVICIHMDPIEINNEKVNNYKELTNKIITEYNPDYKFHDFRLVDGQTHTNLIFDLVVPFSKTVTNDKILNDIRDKFKEEDSSINIVVTVEHSYV